MTNAKTTTRIYEAVNDLDEFRRVVKSQAPALARLLDNLDAGVFPEPLEVMIAISEGVAYLTKCSVRHGGPRARGEITPGRRCSTC